MADEAARRRELRRRKILENAEERRRKIFGATSSTDTSGIKSEAEEEEAARVLSPSVEEVAGSSVSGVQPPSDLQHNSPSSPPSDPAHSSPSNPQSDPVLTNRSSSSPAPRVVYGDPVVEAAELNTGSSSRTAHSAPPSVQNGAVPDLRQQLINLNRLLAANGSLGGGEVHGGTAQGNVPYHPAPVGTLKHSVVPVFIALVVCALLTYSLGYIVSNSIAIPFLVWEVQHLWGQRHVIHSACRGGPGLLGVALVLCGVRQTTISAYTLVLTLSKCFLEDFGLYIFTVIMWHQIIGLPVQEIKVVESNLSKEDFLETNSLDDSFDF